MFAFTLAPPAERLSELRALLSPEESAREARFVFPDLRDKFAAGRGQLRELLGAALGQDPRALGFQYGESGKPALVAGELRFNLSHSGEVALLALSLHRELGVDVEVFKQRAYLEVGTRFFAPAERAELLATRADEQPAKFFDIWTAKEAFVKATGQGITVPLEDFERRWDAPGVGHIEILRGPHAGRPFWLRRLQLGPLAAGALVCEGGPLEVTTGLY